MSNYHRWATSPDLPLWLRLSFYALDHSGVKLAPGQLRYDLSPDVPVTATQISRGIAVAVKRGLLDERSGARCLYIEGSL